MIVAALFKKNLFLQILLLLHVVNNLILLTLPLTKYFSFEFASVNGFFLVIYVGLFTLHEDKFKSSALAVKVFQIKLLLFVGIFLMIPVLLAFIFHLIRSDCSFLDGFKFYAVLTFPAVIIGYALGLLSDFINKKYAYLLFILLLMLIAAIPVIEIFFRPQIYFYNPLIPFFPGTMYDEDIDVTFALALYRFFNLLFFGGIIYLIRKQQVKELKISKSIFYFVIILVAGSFIYFTPTFGFSSTKTSLQKILQKKIETENFIIYLPNRVSKKEEVYIRQLHEFYYERLTSFFKEKPDAKITSFVFATAVEKRKYFGAGNADVAKPWLNQIYLSLDTYEQSVNHELAHIFAGKWSNNILRIDANFNPATVEGIASAADPVYDELDIHYLAFLASQNNLGVSIQNLFSGFSFFSNVSSLSYIYSGSFCKYLMDEYGAEKFRNYYRKGDFEKSFDQPLTAAITRYHKFIKSKNFSNEMHTANYYFGRQPLVQKVCPRYLANKTNAIYKLIDEKNYASARNEILSIKDYCKNYSLLNGLIYCAEAENPGSAETLLTNNLLNYKNTPYYYLLQLKLEDEKILSEKYSEAKSILDSLLVWHPAERLAARVHLRKIFLEKNENARLFLNGEEIDRFTLLVNEFKLNPSVVLLLPLIDYVEEEKYSYTSFKNLIDEVTPNAINEDWYSVLQLVRFTIKNNDFVAAEKFMKLLENTIPNFASESLQNEKDKLAWFIKHEEKK